MTQCNLGHPSQSRPAGHKEIATGHYSHEILHPCQLDRASRGRDIEAAFCWTAGQRIGRVSTKNRVWFMRQPVKVGRVTPDLLDKFKLAFKIGTQADKQQAFLCAAACCRTESGGRC